MVNCPNCGQPVRLTLNLPGQIVRCTTCGCKFEAPPDETQEPHAPAQDPPNPPVPMPYYAPAIHQTLIVQQPPVVVRQHTGNAFAGFLSACFPGLGQLCQGRPGAALAIFIWMVFSALLIPAHGLGLILMLIGWLASIVDAAQN